MKTPSTARRGFTLVEILVALTLLGLVTAGVLKVFIQVLNVYYFDTAKLQINRDIRTFTAALTENATYSNYFVIFPSYNNLTRTASTLVNSNDPDQGYTTAIVDTSINDGQTGDCLVLVYKDPVNDSLTSRIIVYFRSPDPTTGIGPVRVIDLPITPSSNLPVFQLIPTITDPTKYPVVVQLSQDVATGRLFYDYHDRSIIVNGNILQRGGLLNSVHATATDTYNFTVSPRG